MCGIVGVVGVSAVNQRIYDALIVLQHRGQDAAGIMTAESGELFMRKDSGLVRDVFQQKHMLKLKGNIGIGHVRYPTAGEASERNSQPIIGSSRKEKIAGITAQIDELTAATTKQQTESATLERDYREAVREKALEICDKIATLRLDTCAKGTQIKSLENQRLQLQDQVKVLDVQIASAQAQVQAAGDALQGKKAMVDTTEKNIHQAQENLTKARDAALSALKEAFAAFAAWAENAKKVSSYLDLALKTPANPRDAHALAEQGAMGMDLGAVNAELAAGASRMKQERQEVEALWNQKAGNSTIGGGTELPAVSSSDAEGYLKAAADAFKKARDAYSSATKVLPATPVGQNIAWVYQASEAKAWRSLATVSPDDAASALPNAQRLEGLAKEGRENSPYLKNVDTPSPVATK